MQPLNRQAKIKGGCKVAFFVNFKIRFEMKYNIKILDSTKTEATAIGSRHATIVMEGTAGTITASISADGENWTDQDTYEMEGTQATVPATFNCATGTLVQFETTGTFTKFEIIWEG